MKHLPPLFLITFLLISCGVPSTPAPTAALIPSATSVPTLSSTVTPEVTPIATKDPNVPKGYTNNASGKYSKVENGLTYIWDEEREAGYRLYFSGYVLDKTDLNAIDQLLMTVNIDDAVIGEESLHKLKHHANTDPPNTRNWTSLVQDVLYKNMGRAGMFPNPNAFSLAPWVSKEGEPTYHQFHFDFKNSEGPQQWGLWTGSQIVVHIRGDYDALKANAQDTRFSDVKGQIKYGPKMNYMIRMWTENGNLHIDLAPNLPASEWTEKQLMEMFMFAPASIMEGAIYATTPEDAAKLPDYSELASWSTLSIFVLNDEYRLFDIPQ